MTTLGLEFIVTDPAAELRQEIGSIRAALPVACGRRDGSIASRLYQAIKNALSPSFPPVTLSPRHLVTLSPGHPVAQSWLAREPLFLDVETTGRYKKDDPRVVEVAVIDASGYVLFSTLVNPQKPIPAAATAVNGITNADVSDAPLWRDILPHLRRVLEGRFVVGHNIKFDSSFIPADWGIEWACTKDLANTTLGRADWWAVKENPLVGGGLAARLHQLGLEPGPEHTAAGDCLSVLRLLRHLAGHTEPILLFYQ